MVILGIANTLDLPSQLMSRISSRMGKSRLIFTPYKSSQIKEIITQRLSETNLFCDNSINYISKKLACVSSDIRRTLSVCRETVESYKLKYQKDPKGTGNKITIDDVIETMKKAYSSPLGAYVKESHNPTKYLLVAIYNEMKQTGLRFADFNKVYNR